MTSPITIPVSASRTDAGSSVTGLNVQDDRIRWRGVFLVAAIAAILMITIIPVSVAVYIIWPAPEGAVTKWFEVYQANPLKGLLSLDLLFLISNALMIPIYLALYLALRRASESLMTLALVIGLISVTVYLTTNTSVEMLFLSKQHEVATTVAEHAAIQAAGEAMMVTYFGTAFTVYYVFGAVALLLIAAAMLRSTVFSRTTGYLALTSGALVLIPSNAGTVGLVFSLASIVPWVAMLVLLARSFLQFGRP